MLIVEYDKQWLQKFKLIKAELIAALANIDYSIEHVGSTSVPNLAAKPIIDIDIIYQLDAEFEEIKSALIKAGYYHNGDQGIKGRAVFKRSGIVINQTLDNITHHLYVCSANSYALKQHIIFRNFLRNNDDARLAYQEIKYKLAEEAAQVKKIYAELKEESIGIFIDRLIGADLNKK